MADLHSFLASYEEKFPQDVLHIEKEVNAAYEVSEIIHKLEREFKYPIIICHKVRTIKGEISKHPLVSNLLASRKRLAALMGTSIENLGIEYYRRMKEKRKVVKVSKGEAPVKEVVKKGHDVNLFEFPIPIHHEKEPGPYLSAGQLLLYDPDTGIDNTAYHRGWVKDRDLIGVLVPLPQHNAMILKKNEEADRETRACYWVGHHPLVMQGAQAKLGFPESHLEAAGGLVGEPIKLVPSETWGEEFLVPAEAEIIIEGYFKPRERGPEGPFGEYTKHLGPQRWSPTLHVTAITHRKDAYWVDIMATMADHHYAGGIAMEGEVYEAVKKVVPGVIAVRVPYSGVKHHVYVKLRKQTGGDARRVIQAALATEFRVKHVFVFDEDVDIFDDRQVLWALATRCQLDKSLVMMQGCTGSFLDPSVEDHENATMGGFDLTKPVPPEPFSDLAVVPEEVQKRVDLEGLIGKEKLSQLQIDLTA